MKPLELIHQQKPIKFCKDCKHCIVPRDILNFANFATCALTRAVCFVDGTVTYNYCSSERNGQSDIHCGIEGKFFSEIEPANG